MNSLSASYLKSGKYSPTSPSGTGRVLNVHLVATSMAVVAVPPANLGMATV